MSTNVKATIDDLYRIPGKAEIVDGEIVLMSPTGGGPNYAAAEIFVSLRQYSREHNIGRAVTDNSAFRVDLPHRGSFSPAAAFYVGASPGMKFFEGAPIFAVEVRSERDYGRPAEAAMARKRLEYFEAGTLVVWDVDLLGVDVVNVYRGGSEKPTIYCRGNIAEAEPSLPGWTFPVDDLFE
jgi:Uma2 family endonuclease